jgi:hypothetical protein
MLRLKSNCQFSLIQTSTSQPKTNFKKRRKEGKKQTRRKIKTWGRIKLFDFDGQFVHKPEPKFTAPI